MCGAEMKIAMHAAGTQIPVIGSRYPGMLFV